MNIIRERLAVLRQAMSKAEVAAYIIPGTDPHAGEYIADHWKEREWISGFDGSAGTVVVTANHAKLWTDSRYFLQAGQQLEGTGFEVMKMGLPETPDITTWLTAELKPGEKAGLNAQMFSMNTYAAMEKRLKAYKTGLVAADLISGIWNDRPSLPTHPCFIFDTSYAGQSFEEKLSAVKVEMKKNLADAYVLSALDDIAWLFNIRGTDVAYNPVVIAYALITNQDTTLYISPEKLTPELNEYFATQNVKTKAYQQIYNDLYNLPAGSGVLVDGDKLNRSLYEAIPASCEKISMMSPVFKLKSIKNKVEINSIRKVMIQDGVALTRFFIWLEANIGSEKQTEVSASEKLYSFRKEQDGFYGESFATIAGFADHGAIVHYRADEAGAYTLKPDNILLLDSGGQYLSGTTDITRTVIFCEPTAQQKTDFTLVLKGHIGIATAIFPVGTRGSQLDILARKSMWDRGINYGHGTGHGVGFFLNVHEGPQNIRMDENPVTLQPGMIISNEPGLYRTGEYGIRTENLVHVTESDTTEFGKFLKFETLTLFPIDVRMIDKTMLTSNETDWLNNYHREVYEKLSPSLNTTEQAWLRNKTKAI